VTGFLQACLYVFAACTALGILPAAALAAKARNLAGFFIALLVAVFVIWVLCASAVTL
jgi:hypothetical protein